MSVLFTKRINNEIKKYKKENFLFPNVLLKPNDSNLREWYFIIYDLKDTDYEGGYYFGEIMLPMEYPVKPPDFKIYTPSGRFDTNKKICTSFTGFHSNEHASSQNLVTLSQGVVSFMTDDDETGIGSISMVGKTSSECKEICKSRKKFASESMSFNMSNEKFRRVFGEEDLKKIM